MESGIPLAALAGMRFQLVAVFVSVLLGACAASTGVHPEDGRAAGSVRVAVLGEVERPGWATCSSRCDVNEAVQLVGGTTELARSVTLRRRGPDGRWETQWFPLGERRTHRLEPGDIVMIGATM